MTEPFDLTLLPVGLRTLDLSAMASEFGTPLFVYDEAHLRERCREYVTQFGSNQVAYAVCSSVLSGSTTISECSNTSLY